MLKTKSLWHLSAKKSILREDDLTERNGVLVKANYSLISLGTERLVASGEVPENLYESMKVPYQEGSFNFPIKYGYSLVGEVQTAGHHLFGKRVHLLHPHQNYCWVDEKDLFVIPDEVDSETATLASNLETALNAVWDSGVSIGDEVLIVGFGLVGALLASLLQIMPGTKVAIWDTDLSKQALAKKLGFQIMSKDSKYDFAFHCSASSAGLQTCIDATGFESKIIELSWYGNQSTAIRLGDTFHSQRKQIISSQVSRIPADRQSRWNYKRRKETVFNLLKAPIFKHHISQKLKFADVPEFFDQIRKRETSGLGIIISY